VGRIQISIRVIIKGKARPDNRTCLFKNSHNLTPVIDRRGNGILEWSQTMIRLQNKRDDIKHAAAYFLRRYGMRASREAQLRATALKEAGDEQVAAFWLRVQADLDSQPPIKPSVH
jgi:hypothetical protein